MVLQQQIFDLRHDGRSPAFQNLREVGGVAGVDSLCWRPEKENKLSTRGLKSGLNPAAGMVLTFSPDAQFGSPRGAAEDEERGEESGELHRRWQDLNQVLGRAGAGWGAGERLQLQPARRRSADLGGPPLP